MTITGITNASNSNRLGGSNWPLTATIDANKYYQFTVTPTSGYQFTPSSMSFIWDRSGTGPSSLAIRSSLDNYATDIAVLNGVTASTSAFNTLVMSAMGDVQVTTTFRIYAYNATGAGGTAGFDTGSNVNNIILYGTTSLITGSTAASINGTTSICSGDSAVIDVAITGGRSPFTLVYTDGTNNFTESNYISGASIVVTPTVTTTYSIVSITDSNALVGTGNSGTADITVLNNTTYYVDADSDGYGNASNSIVACFSLAGYVSNNSDCNDAVSSTNPGAVDVCYDGIDNDCNGNVDNVGLPGGCIPIVSTIPSATCNSIVAYNQIVYTSLVSGAQSYRYRVTEVNPSDDSEISGTQVIATMILRNLYLRNLSNYKYNAKYKVEVAVLYNNVWQAYDPNFCYVWTDSPVSTIVGCGTPPTQVSSINTAVSSTIVSRCPGYKYQVTRLDNSYNAVGTSQEIATGIRNFRFSQVTDMIYDAYYEVKCSVRNTDGTYLPYGPSCIVQAPKYPVSELVPAQCEDYAVLNYNEYINAVFVSGAEFYRFRLTSEVNNYDVSG